MAWLDHLLGADSRSKAEKLSFLSSPSFSRRRQRERREALVKVFRAIFPSSRLCPIRTPAQAKPRFLNGEARGEEEDLTKNERERRGLRKPSEAIQIFYVSLT